MQKSGALQWLKRGAALAAATSILSACGGGDGGGSGGDSASGANTAPTISGTPATTAAVGAGYNFTPSAKDPDGDALAFSVQNKPVWATFDTTSGQLSGVPRTEHVGPHANVVISVSDGKASVSLPPFSITVGAGDGSSQAPSPTPTPVTGNAVTLSWNMPAANVDGGSLNDLSGYRIHYGKSAAVLNESIEIPSAGTTSYVVRDLKPGTYYFVVRAVTSSGAHSEPSNAISRIIS